MATATAEAGPEVLSVRRFESGPPLSQALEVAGAAGDTYATTKEEEWVTKKKTELTTTRQIETRVQRQVVLEDGHVVEDSGPMVSTNTTEDTQKHEQKSTEHRTTGDAEPGPEWVAVAPPNGVLEEVTEKIVRTREEQQDRTETEDVAHLGDISDQAYQAAVTSGVDLRSALCADIQRSALSAGPRLVASSSKKRRVVDSADVETRRQATPDGRVLTETRRTTEHEEDADEELPDDDGDQVDGAEDQETRKEGSSKFIKTKDEDLVEYLADGVKVGEEMRFHAERTDGERRGACADAALHQRDWDSLSARMRHLRRKGALPAAAAAPAPLDRKDALTRRPLDFDQEEETRKHETSKWLTHHFGSESRSGSDDDGDIPAAGTNTSFINVTMKSRPLRTTPTPDADQRRFTRIASPDVAASGLSSPVNGYLKTSSLSSPVNGYLKTSALSSPVNGFTAKTSTLSSPVESAATPKSYMATVNSSTRVYMSSPESEEVPGSRRSADGFFQGVSDWERRRETRQTLDVAERVATPPATKTFAASTPYRINGDRHSPVTRGFVSGNLVSSEARHQLIDRTPSSPAYRPSSRELNRSRQDLVRSHQDLARSNLELSRSHQELNGGHSGYVRQELNQSSYMVGSPRQHLDRVGSPGGSTPRGASPAHGRVGHAVNGWAEHEDDGYRGYRGRQDEPAPDYSPPNAVVRTSPSGDRDSPSGGIKKHFQRTRFAADIPPPTGTPRPQATTTSTTTRSKSPGNIIGDSFRKLVGKFRSRSTERKRKNSAAAAATAATSTTKSRSPSPNTYRPYAGVDPSGESDEEAPAPAPVAPPRVSRQSSQRQDAMERAHGTGIQRYYLGEDPFGGSIYGREKEYDGVTPVKRRSQHRNGGHRRGSREEDDMNRMNVHHVTSSSTQQTTSTSTLGRLSQSTGRLTAPFDSSTRHAQTLPRKLHSSHTPAQIQVSIVNQVTPAKPARTYRSTLGRSQSFSVQPLGDSAAPLKTPALLASLSRSQRDLTSPEPRTEVFRSNQDSFRTSQDTYKSAQDNEKKEEFMKGLLDRAPELFKTLHGDDASAVLPPGQIYTSTPVRHTVVETTHTTTTSKPMHNGYSATSPTSLTSPLRIGLNGNGALRNGLIMDSTHSNGTSPSRTGYSSPLRGPINGNKSSRVVESSHSFRSSSTNDSDPVRHLSSPYRQPIERGASPSLYAASTNRGASPSLYSATRGVSPFGASTALANGTSRSVERRGSSDDYTETVRINSKSDDPLRPSETSTVKSFSKKVVPSHAGRATETVESHETTTVTKSRLRGGPGGVADLSTGYPTRNGGVVIQVRPDRM